MNESRKSLIIALVITGLMTVFALIEQIRAFGDDESVDWFSPVSILVWVGSFCFVTLFWYIVVYALLKWSAKKQRV